MNARHAAIASIFALVLAAQAAWSVVTTSGTYDETTYLQFGQTFYGSGDATAFANWGVAPLPVLLTSAAPAVARRPGYPQMVTAARVAAIVLFGIPLIIVTYWTLLGAAGPRAAVAGTALVSLSPNIVAHAALATTDVCFTVAALAALAALARYLDERSPRSRLLLAITLIVALAAKYSALLLFAIVVIAYAANGDRRTSGIRRLIAGAVLSATVLAVALLFVWLLHAGAVVPFGLAPIETMRLPAAIVGIARQLHHESLGEPAFLLGRRSTAGWWYYLPVALAMKSTPAELLVGALACVAFVAGWRRGDVRGLVWRVAVLVFVAAGILNRLELGVRYELILIPLSIFLAAEWSERIGRRQWHVPIAAALVAMQLWSAWSIAPHDLSYFNIFAGGPAQGYRRLADSNVDWGQDLPALADQLARLRARRPLLSYFGTAPLDAYGVNAEPWDARVSAPFERWDWVAISATNLDGVFLRDDPFADFRTLIPDARAGYSILLYSTAHDAVRRAMATAARRLP